MLHWEQKEGKAYLWNISLPARRTKADKGVYLAQTPFSGAEQEVFVTNQKNNPLSFKFSVPPSDHKKAARETQLYASAPAHEFRQHNLAPLRSSRKSTLATGARLQMDMAAFLAQLKKHLSTYEFWLGFGCGMVARITTKLAILTAFSSAAAPRLSTFGSFVACAGAGIATGIITYLVRAAYRNANLRRGAAREEYWGMGLFESATVGWLGGILGGFTTNAGVIVAGSGSFVVGAAAGALVGILRALVKGDGRGEEATMAWGRLAFQSAVFGAFGGALGVISSHLFGARVSIASPVPVGEADSVIYTNPSASYHEDFCGSDLCEAPPPAPMPPPMQVVMPVVPVVPMVAVPVITPQETIIHVVHEYPKPHIHHHVHHVAAPHPQKTCFPVKQAHHVRHVKHIPRHARQIEYEQPPFEVIYTAPPPPPQIIMPPPALAPMQPVNPCDTDNCAVPCNHSQLDIKGPCGDPNVPCVERVSFNENGEATKVVLEPQAVKTASSYFEIRHTPDAAKVSNLNNGGNNVVADSNVGGSDTKVSLVVPLSNNHTLALADKASALPAA